MKLLHHFTLQHRIHQIKPSMAIGRNYRLELENRLRTINQSRENTLSLKILDEHSHLIKPPTTLSKKICKSSKDKHKMNLENNKSSGVVPLAVNHF